jgi:hypothetical protein
MKTEGGLTITAELTYPNQRRADDSLIAFVCFKLSDGRGFELVVKSARLKWDHGKYLLSLPSEPKLMRCVKCSRQNADHASYCNWCGSALVPQGPKGWFMDVVCPTNQITRDAMLRAAAEEHERISGAAAAKPNNLAVQPRRA